MVQAANSVLELIGNTPLVKLNRLPRSGAGDVYAKIEGLNPGGSVKDRIGLGMVEDAERRGALRPGGTIVEPTSGNTGVGLTLVAAVKGYKMIAVMPDKVPIEKVRLLEAYGARVELCPTAVEADDPRSYYKVSERLERETPGGWRPNQYANPFNPEAHYQTTGPEIWRQTEGKIHSFVTGMGTGGTITGAGRYLKEQRQDVRVVGVDTVGSILKEVFETGRYTEEPHTYLIDGIGEDFVPAVYDFKFVDEVIRVSDRDAYQTARRLAREEGILSGSSAGAAVWAAVEVAGRLESGDIVVVLIPDTGERYLSKLNDGWMQEKGLL